MEDHRASGTYYATPPPIHHPYYQPQPPPPPPPPGTSSSQAAILLQAPLAAPSPIYQPDELRTLFIAGFPEDVKPREIYNLFREFPGYQSSNLRPSSSSNSQPFAFATFTDQQSAIMALHALNGLVFDLEKGSTLHIDLAKSNSRSKRTREDDVRQNSGKRHKSSVSYLPSYDPGVGSVHLLGMTNSAYNTIGYPPTQSDGGSVHGRQIKSNNIPCPTLFVANLGPTCTEEELTQVFSRCRGYLKLKMQSTYGSPVAFVDFQDTASSTEALSWLQGTILHSSTSSEGMRLEFAKSRMGMRSKKSM